MKVFARLLGVLFLLFTALPGHAATRASQAPSALPAPTPGRLTVYFLDVGQGDAALIVSPTGKTVLIDGGPPEAGTRLAARLRELVNQPLDLVILTHPHLDHLGGLPAALKAVGAKRFMDPGFDHPSEAYRALLDFVGREVGQVMTPEPSASAPQTLLTVGLGEGVSLTMLWPRMPREPFLANTRSDANANSIVAKLTYAKTSFLFTGDSEPPTEEALLQKPLDLTATVLKVAHHGGKHSSTAAFLDRVAPQAAVISCGVGNDYGHPSPEVMGRLRDVHARTFRTDQDGEVMAVSDGATVTLRSSKGAESTVSVSGAQQAGSPVALGPIEPTPDRRSGHAVEKPPEPGGAPKKSKTAPSAPAPTSASEETGQNFVSLKGSKVFHRESCSTLKRSKNERTVYTRRADALRERRPAEDCHP
ncbi:ComEC/Rec2 family competence protein [Corallococcus sp. bb12-1]|uniref:ComEC/Rec2 family competence protein n=1 Tax=Corallococcus sp. bb12-1 TaxID=2996784 RepID=UPI0022708BC1|nr:ComEC/Rec2 family competence protein [Corallococcus sp. bb12-1]MCY1042501.1 ComEC/Rec2 family competence protein [Corallococcus sp. bb12-1]